MKDPDVICTACRKVLPHREFSPLIRHDAPGRDVHSHCKSCRRDAYRKRRYPDEICATCHKHGPLEGLLSCRRCLAGAGLRLCRKCGIVLPLFVFYGRSRTCSECR